MEQKLSEERIRALEAALRTKTVAVIGDFCVDVYWEADMTRSELSRETPHFPLPVVQERFYPGAGGNVAANVSALGPERTIALTLTGEDWRGALLRGALSDAGINCEAAVRVPGRFTNAYCKPIRRGISDTVYEDPRLDFENDVPPDAKTEKMLLDGLRRIAAEADVICVSDQFRCGCVTPAIRSALSGISKKIPVIADSRLHIADFQGCILKPNEVECWRAVYGDDGYRSASEEAICAAADALSLRMSVPVFCTLGSRGSVFTDGKARIRTRARNVAGPLDICGAGDTTLAAFACAIAAGASYAEAAALAALASAVTVKKLGVTGTASFDEICRENEAADCVLNGQLASTL